MYFRKTPIMKRISFFALALCAGIAANAQNEPQLRTPMAVKPMFGIEAGVNLANLEIKDDATANAGTNYNSKTSIHAGVFYDVPVTAAFHIKPALLYSIQGAKSNAMVSANPTLAGITEIDLHYISLPVMFKFKTPGGFAVEAGPQFSYLSSANADKSTGDEVNLKDGEFVKDVDFALVGGVGYTSRIGLGLHAKYNYGFTNVWNNEKSPVAASGMDARNRVVQIGLHYAFGAAK
jgi:hypothetical protein